MGKRRLQAVLRSGWREELTENVLLLRDDKGGIYLRYLKKANRSKLENGGGGHGKGRFNSSDASGELSRF